MFLVKHNFTIRIKLLLIVLVTVLPLFAELAWELANVEENALKAAYANIKARADTTAAELAHVLRDHEALLARLAERPLVKALDRRHCDPFGAEFVALHPEFTTLTTRDTSGNIICSASDRKLRRWQPGDAPWFDEAVHDSKFGVGDAVLGRTSGRWRSVLSYPLLDAEGKLAGVIALPLDLLKLNQRLFGGGLDNVMVAVYDRDQNILLRSVDPELWLGKSIPAKFIKQKSNSREGFVITEGVDGITRLSAWVTVAGTGWQVVAGMPETEVLAPMRLQRRYSLAFSGCILLLVFFFAWRIASSIIKPIQSMANTAASVADGNLLVRAKVGGSVELERVAREFNRMLDVRTEIENALHESEERLRDFLSLSTDWVWETDAVGRFTSISEGVVLQTGIPVADYIGKKQWEMSGSAWTEAQRETLRAAVASHQHLHNFELKRVNAQAETRWVSVNARSLFDAEGAFRGYRGTSIDITARRQAEIALEKALSTMTTNERLWKFALEGAGDGVWDNDLVTGELTVSESWKQMFGYADAPGSHFEDYEKLIHPDDLPQFKKIRQLHLDDDAAYMIEHRFKCGDGTWKWVESRGEIVARDANGRPLRKIGTDHDISARKDAEAALEAQVAELRRWHDATLGRELRVVELKREINELLLAAGQPIRYESVHTNVGNT